MPTNIDFDRGVIIKQHKSGAQIYMYRAEPGHYLSSFGSEVSEELAKEAGFDIERFSKARLKGERMATAMAAIEEELSAEPGEEKVVADRKGFTVVDIGMGRHVVKDPDGNNLVADPMPKDVALLLLEKLTPDEPKPKPAAREKAPKEAEKE